MNSTQANEKFAAYCHTLGDVLPRLTLQYQPDGIAATAIATCQRSLWHPLRGKYTEFANRFVSKFGTLVVLTHCSAALNYLVGHIISRGAFKEIGGITTGWAVALMASKHPCLEWAIGKFVGYAMRLLMLAHVINNAIAILITRTQPWPASIRASRSVNFSPKLWYTFHVSSSHTGVSRAEGDYSRASVLRA